MVTILILIDGFLQFEEFELEELEELVTILILIDGFLQLKNDELEEFNGILSQSLF